jgi:hypothetical protein
MGVLMRGLEEAFAFCGGVPGELLFDQLKAVIIDDQRAVGGRLLENAEFLRFANHWDFRIRACRPYRAKTKGKVERPIRYVRESFFYGRHFLNDADLNAQARSWMVAVANQRQHRTTGERPQLRFERDEQAALIPLAMQRYRSLVLPSSPPGRIRPPRSALPTVEHRDLADYARLVGVHR